MVKSSANKSYDLAWKEFFRDPSQWWDNRSSKACPSYPDFKHKITKESLRIDGWYNPPWVGEELSKRGLVASIASHNGEHFDNGGSTDFVALLRACTKDKDLSRGSTIHDEILKQGLLEKCSDALVTMYAKCGELAKAEELLGMHKSRNVYSWTALITGYAQLGQGQDALDCYERMKEEGMSPDAVTFLCVLKSCGSIGAVEKGEEIHDEMARQGFLENNVVLGNALVDMYSKCGALAKAQKALEELRGRDVVSWSSLIDGYAQHGEGEQALNCFDRMQREGIHPNEVTFLGILKACGSLGAVDKGKKFHDQIISQGLLRNNVLLGNTLVDMYAKCGALIRAQKVLDELPSRTVSAWSALIGGYAQDGQSEQALNCFARMQCEGLSPNAVTFLCLLKACGNVGEAHKGERIHKEIAKRGLLENDIVLGTALVDMYAKCGDLGKAQRILEELPSRDIVTYNALLAGYAQEGQYKQALNCFECMQREGLSADAGTYFGILKACGNSKAAHKGEQICDEIARRGLLEDDVMLANAMVDMYVRCGAPVKARQVLDDLPVRDVISWSAVIAGYARQGQGEQALDCLEKMQREGLRPNAVTLLCILQACGSIGAADRGEEIHNEIARQGLLREHIELGNALVDMYAKCGALTKAQEVLAELHVRDVISWNALISGYAQEGQCEQILTCFEEMKRDGVSPDVVTFLCILKACSSIGDADRAEQIHEEIKTRGLFESDLALGDALVDMYAKCGALEKAQSVVEELPGRDVVYWSAMLGSCVKSGDVNVGRWAFDHVVQLDRSDGAAYSIMANIYAAAGMLEDAKKIGAMRIENNARKMPSHSLVG